MKIRTKGKKLLHHNFLLNWHKYIITKVNKNRNGGIISWMLLVISSCWTKLQLQLQQLRLRQLSTSPLSAPRRLCTRPLGDWREGEKQIRFCYPKDWLLATGKPNLRCKSNCSHLVVQLLQNFRAWSVTQNQKKQKMSSFTTPHSVAVFNNTEKSIFRE